MLQNPFLNDFKQYSKLETFKAKHLKQNGFVSTVILNTSNKSKAVSVIKRSKSL